MYIYYYIFELNLFVFVFTLNQRWVTLCSIKREQLMNELSNVVYFKRKLTSFKFRF